MNQSVRQEGESRASTEGTLYLSSYLKPLALLLARDDVTDIYVNRPGEIWVEGHRGTIERHDVPALTDTVLSRLSRQIAAVAHQGISREHPLLSASLPDGARVQVVAPPATRGGLVLAIRKHLARDLTLADYDRAGSFADTGGGSDRQDATDAAIAGTIGVGRFSEALRLAVRARKNILVSGGTSTGKTTFLNALIREVPLDERLIFIEDTPELNLAHANAVGLIAVRGSLGEAQVTADDLLAASLRMRPDRIIVGELRGPEAYTFLRAVNTGHPGSMTTVHADSPARAIEQIALLVLQTGTRLGRDDVRHYIRNTIDLFVQLDRVGGQRRVAAVALRSELD